MTSRISGRAQRAAKASFQFNGEEHADHDGEQEEVVDHGDDAGGEKFVEGVDVSGDAGDHAADGIFVVVGHGQALQVAENLLAHVVHGLLADMLHDADLNVLREEIEEEDEQVDYADDDQAVARVRERDGVFDRGSEEAVDGRFEKVRRGQFERRDGESQRERQEHTPFVRAHIGQQAAHQPRVVRFT